MSDQDELYEIKGVVDSSEVPNWARRTPKWKKLIDRILELKPRQSLTVEFPDYKTARQARNTVRDTINLRQGSAVIRTRVVDEDKDGKNVTVYFSRLADADVVHEHREEPDSGKGK